MTESVERTPRVVAVTGAGSGMGLAAVQLGMREYDVVVAIDLDHRALSAFAVSSNGGRLQTISCDVTSAGDVADAARAVVRDFGRVDALLNFAGVSDFAPAAETDQRTWERQIRVNLTGTFLCCQAFGNVMLAQRSGAIVNVASTAGLFGVPGMAAYSAAKHGVVGLTKALSVEWARFGVRVNCICPGATLTPMLLSTTPEFRASRVRRVPMGRLGEPGEQASVALFLASPRASYVTGAIVPVDGGVSALAPGVSESTLQGEA